MNDPLHCWYTADDRMEQEETSERRSLQPDAVGDDQLMAALVRGERDALGTLYDRHAGVLLAIAVRLIGSRAQAEELLHDASWRRGTTPATSTPPAVPYAPGC